MTSSNGACPACELSGAIGDPCAERGCLNRGYHFIPTTFLLAAKEAARAAARGAAHADLNPMIGRVVGDFLVVGTIGAGGFGAVHLALQRPRYLLKAALKLMHTGASDPAMAEVLLDKFQNEGDALAVLHHPNIVRLLKYGIHNDTPYLVMEYVDGGRTLKKEVRDLAEAGRKLDARVARHVLRQTLYALGEAHGRAQPIIHRDLKPENIMLQSIVGDPNHVKVLDFGLAKFVEERTQTSIAMGTPAYMAPEQLERRNIGPWTDLYAVGVIAFELLTGRKAFVGTTQQEILAQKLDPAYDPGRRLADVPASEVALAFFRRALARKWEDRYHSADEFLESLDAVLAASPDGQPLRGAPADLSGLLNASDLLRIRRRASHTKTPAGERDPEALSAWLEAQQRRLESEEHEAETYRTALMSASLLATAAIPSGVVVADGVSEPGAAPAASSFPKAAPAESTVGDGLSVPVRRPQRFGRGPAVAAIAAGVAAVVLGVVFLWPKGERELTPVADGEAVIAARAAASGAPPADPAVRERATPSAPAGTTASSGPPEPASPAPAVTEDPLAEDPLAEDPTPGRRKGAAEPVTTPAHVASAPAVPPAPAPDAGTGATGEAVDVVAEVVAPPAIVAVRVTSYPGGAAVREGRRRLGKTPLTVELAPAQTRSFTISYRGYETARVDVAETDAPARVIELVPRRATSGKARPTTRPKPPGSSGKPRAPDTGKPGYDYDLL